MSFLEELKQYSWEETKKYIYSIKSVDVERVLAKRHHDIYDFMALISPEAERYLEPMSALSRKYTQQRFGKTMQFYIPLYLSNACVNHCIYCGFNHNNPIHRMILNDEQILKEVKAIKSMGGFEHILLVAGESPRQVGIDYMENAIKLIKPYFASISLEVQPLKQEEYTRLINAGLNAVYCYQETYNQKRYKIYHPKGIKSNFERRLDTFERMGRATIHKMGLGVLIGLEDWRTDVTMMALHLRYLQKHYWRTKYSISFPRMRPHEGDIFQPNIVMNDKELAQLIFAFRIFDNDIEIALSTRESQKFRDNMLTLGVTSMSAGSKTDPGGYAACVTGELEQFSVNDNRSPKEILEVVKSHHYEAVWKDWDQALN
ncbi:MAG: 2-iminoacetate synthase ThiH [Bacteroidales bacterium]|jgi:2-iminoacetate synthase|nr:2-iminoacetate synthase ThiH [Bacteroidales bacterium]